MTIDDYKVVLHGMFSVAIDDQIQEKAAGEYNNSLNSAPKHYLNTVIQNIAFRYIKEKSRNPLCARKHIIHIGTDQPGRSSIHHDHGRVVGPRELVEIICSALSSHRLELLHTQQISVEMQYDETAIWCLEISACHSGNTSNDYSNAYNAMLNSYQFRTATALNGGPEPRMMHTQAAEKAVKKFKKTKKGRPPYWHNFAFTS